MIDIRYIALAFMLVGLAAQAEQMYVTDELVITLRTGPSTENTIIANLRSGDAVDVLEHDADRGYSRVRVIGEDDEGWVLTRYLMAEPASDAQLNAASSELAGARQRIMNLESELAQTVAELNKLRETLAGAEEARRHVSVELEEIRTASASVLELQAHNRSLRERNLELSTQVDALVAEASRLGDRSRQNWFVVGALVLVFGIVIGLVAPSLRMRRRSRW